VDGFAVVNYVSPVPNPVCPPILRAFSSETFSPIEAPCIDGLLSFPFPRNLFCFAFPRCAGLTVAAHGFFLQGLPIPLDPPASRNYFPPPQVQMYHRRIVCSLLAPHCWFALGPSGTGCPSDTFIRHDSESISPGRRFCSNTPQSCMELYPLSSFCFRRLLGRRTFDLSSPLILLKKYLTKSS